ncbi:MAG: 50S ribosomal protein L4 [Rickettsiales bacterium]|jgi:large subunit ribosomal protein L4|nr:50S ribosomal protein L4 [Rickettsiales bacterium]
MKLVVLNLNNMKEDFETIDDIDFENLDGVLCVPQTVKWQLAGRRLGTASTKLMSEISGSTRKIVRQKGSGGARHGSKRATQFVGGRVAFGPRPRDFGFKFPKKMVKKALGYVIRDKIKNNRLILIEGMDMAPISTNGLNKKLAEKGIGRALVAYEEEYKNFLLSLRNLYNYKALFSGALNVYDIMNFDYLLVDRKSLDKIKEVI